MVELKPCPFCGGEMEIGVVDPLVDARVIKHKGNNGTICILYRGIAWIPNEPDGGIELTTLWNRRADNG